MARAQFFTSLNEARDVDPALLDYFDVVGSPAPAVSAVGSGRLYFDAGAGKWKISESGAAFVDVVGGAAVTFPLLATPAGSAAAPSYSSLLDPTTGAFVDTPGEFAISVAALEAGRFTPTIFSVKKGFGTVASSPAALAAGLNNNYNLPAAHFIRLTPTAPGSTITGMTGGVDGRFAMVFNVGATTLTFTNQDVASGAPNRIITTTGGPVVLNIGSKAWFVYDATTARWRMIFAL